MESWDCLCSGTAMWQGSNVLYEECIDQSGSAHQAPHHEGCQAGEDRLSHSCSDIMVRNEHTRRAYIHAPSAFVMSEASRAIDVVLCSLSSLLPCGSRRCPANEPVCTFACTRCVRKCVPRPCQLCMRRVQDELQEMNEVSCANTGSLVNIDELLQERCCSALGSPTASALPAMPGDQGSSIAEWSCMCPPDTLLVPGNSFELCQQEQSGALAAVPPGQCTEPSVNVMTFECLATMERLQDEDGMACADVAKLDETITDAVAWYCCGAATPGQAPLADTPDNAGR